MLHSILTTTWRMFIHALKNNKTPILQLCKQKSIIYLKILISYRVPYRHNNYRILLYGNKISFYRFLRNCVCFKNFLEGRVSKLKKGFNRNYKSN